MGKKVDFKYSEKVILELYKSKNFMVLLELWRNDELVPGEFEQKMSALCDSINRTQCEHNDVCDLEIVCLDCGLQMQGFYEAQEADDRDYDKMVAYYSGRAQGR